MATPSVLVIGSSNTDMLVKVERLPQSGETVLGGEFVTASGGKGANQAVAAARAGGEVTFIARIGEDAPGELAMKSLESNAINTAYVVRDTITPSGVALIVVARNGQNSIAVAPGANDKLAAADVRKASAAFRKAQVVLLQLETPLRTAQASIELARSARVPVILNPAPAQPLTDRLLSGLYLLTPNEIEAQLLTGIAVANESSAAQAADALLARGVLNVVITMGARGAFVAGQDCHQFIPALKVKAVDATGAGDVFNGALAVAIAEGKSLFDAARFANVAAALSVTGLGAQTAPRRKAIEQALANASATVANGDGASAHSVMNGNGSTRSNGQPRKRASKLLAPL
jgi:ribokinase